MPCRIKYSANAVKKPQKTQNDYRPKKKIIKFPGRKLIGENFCDFDLSKNFLETSKSMIFIRIN